MYVIGIDPGLSGGIAVIDRLLPVDVMDTPVLKGKKSKKFYDIQGMAGVLREYTDKMFTVLAVLERQQAMPTQGVSSTFKTGEGYGIWQGLLTGLSIPYITVHPRTWTKKVLQGARGDGKARSILMARQLFPTAELIPPRCRVPKDGRADALCLAYYGLNWGDIERMGDE